MDVSSTCLALLLLAEPGSVAAGASPAPGGEEQASSHPEAGTFSGLRLSKVRVRTPSGSYVLRRPRFGPDGIAWRSTDGFPRGPRPLLAPGWDTVPPPPNPVPWNRVELLERPLPVAREGAVIGGATGAVIGAGGGAFLGWASLLAGGGSWGTLLVWTGMGALAGGLIVGVVAHVVFDPPERWERIEVDAAGDAESGERSR